MKKYIRKYHLLSNKQNYHNPTFQLPYIFTVSKKKLPYIQKTLNYTNVPTAIITSSIFIVGMRNDLQWCVKIHFLLLILAENQMFAYQV